MEKSMLECFSCKEKFIASDGPTHPYMASTPGCWQMYGEVLAREYSSYDYWQNHRLTVDAYAVQHPGQESPQSIQSVAVHLISLFCIFEQGVSHDDATRMIKKATQQKFHWLVPPDDLGDVTVKSVWLAQTAKEHNSKVEHWARSVWSAWFDHHPTVEDWVATLHSA